MIQKVKKIIDEELDAFANKEVVGSNFESYLGDLVRRQVKQTVAYAVRNDLSTKVAQAINDEVESQVNALYDHEIRKILEKKWSTRLNKISDRIITDHAKEIDERASDLLRRAVRERLGERVIQMKTEAKA